MYSKTRGRIAALVLALPFVVACAATAAAQAPAATAAKPASTSSLALLAKDLPNIEGKEVTMSEITYPPGFASAPHRHDANTFVYVLQGTMQMQVGGGQVLTLKPGQTFYESPTDVHATSKNASATEPAKILVFMIKDKGKPASRPAN
jgi:quercetin dioxygenase-like cupin family protein